MAYTSYNVQRTYFPTTPQEFYTETFKEFHKDSFRQASDVQTISKYNPITGLYTNVVVRVNHISTAKPTGQSSTATNNYDDYREIIFEDYDTITSVGERYQYDGYTWLTVTTDNIGQITKSCVIRKCNNFLRWYDDSGVYNIEPCIILDKLDDSGNSYSQNMALLNGAVTILAQATNNVKLIENNKRFLFGQQAFKIESIKNFIYDGLYTFDLYKDQLHENLDDKINNIADKNRNIWTLNIVESNLDITIGNTAQLNIETLYNGASNIKPVTFESSDDLIATVDNTGLITAISNGSVTISCYFNDEPSIVDTMTVNVVAIPVDNIVVVINPIIDKLLENTEQIFTVYKTNNGVVQPDTFNIVATGAVIDSYELTIIDGNTFKVANLKYYSNNNISITTTSVIDSSNKTIEFKLGGAW